MGFLDNSGDIILDAVLTDTGRKRLARGDGSFNVAKFALGDDEINYRLYDKNHASGSPYYDIEILQTPVLEAFTNNTSTMKSKLITISRTNILYLPILKLNQTNGSVSASKHSTGIHLVGVDSDTTDKAISLLDFGIANSGLINGYLPTSNGNYVCFDQGIDNTDSLNTITLDPDLTETQFVVQIDNRFGALTQPSTDGIVADYSFLDDDDIAHYYFTMGSTGNNNNFITNLDPALDSSDNKSVLLGKRGTRFMFGIKSSESLTQSTFLFTKLGTEVTIGGKTFYNIDTTVRIMGATTGYSVELPIRFIKYKS